MRFAICLSVLGFLAVGGAAVAGPNPGGVLLVHTDSEMVYTSACSAADTVSSWTELDPTGPGTGVVNWIVVVAFPPDGAEELNTVSFGLGDYNSASTYIAQAEVCHPELSPLEIPSAGWPGPGTGTSVSWAPNCPSGSLVPIYRFQTYVYAAGSIPLAPNPAQSWERALVRCDNTDEPILGFGRIGFGEEGYNPDPGQAGVHVQSTWGVIQTESP